MIGTRLASAIRHLVPCTAPCQPSLHCLKPATSSSASNLMHLLCAVVAHAHQFLGFRCYDKCLQSYIQLRELTAQSAQATSLSRLGKR